MKFNLRNKRILVTGGSGSMGKQLIKKLIKFPVSEIISLSRDEELIKKAETEITDKKVRFEIGDISDKNKVNIILKNVDIVFHTAALKHVGLAEKYPREILRINVLGLLNLLDNSQNIKRFINISSDKAINVINCYGASKLFAEYLIKESNRIYSGIYLNIRCPNLLGSRGSVIDLWKKQINQKNTISITDPEMTRYFITIPHAGEFIIDTALKDNIDEKKIFYPQKNIGKFKLGDLAKAFIGVFGNKNTTIQTIGVTSGEKMFEDYICASRLYTVNELEKLIKDL